MVDRKVLLPPLGLVTVAAILPQTWEFKLCDRNIREVTEEEWAWADMVIMSAMIVQKQDLITQIKEAKQRGKLVAIGGPYPTSVTHEVQNVGTDFLILDEGEITLPMFVEAIERGVLCACDAVHRQVVGLDVEPSEQPAHINLPGIELFPRTRSRSG
jgi:radical SAM superfamily enzyme YgiQ (UPF0313 family)